MNILDDLTYKIDLKNNRQLIDSILELYDLSQTTTIKLLNYSENTTYLVEDKVKNVRTILRINRPGYHTKEEIEDELVWMKAIYDSSIIIVPKPIAGKNGEYVQLLNRSLSSRQYCVMISYLNGKAPDEAGENNLISQFENLGEVTARLHDQSQKWERSRCLKRYTWDFDTMLGSISRWGRWQDGPNITPSQMELFQKTADTIEQRLIAFGKSPQRFGLIHADLRLANLLVEQDNIKVIDFDDCGYGWFLYDLGSALSFIEHKEFVPKLIRSWLKGYKRVLPVSYEEEIEIPTFIMLRRLLLLGWLGTHHDCDTAKELGPSFAENTVYMAENYLNQFE